MVRVQHALRRYALSAMEQNAYVLFQFEFQPEDLGLLFAFVPALGIDDAAKFVYACNEVQTHECRGPAGMWNVA